MRIALTGASGLVGQALMKHFPDVTPFARRPGDARAILWDPAEGTIESEKLEGFDAVIHLAGENIAGRRWNDHVKASIRDSRVRGTKLLAETLRRLKQPPRVFLSASAVGYYGDRGNETLTETSAPGKSFLADVCVDWENAAALLQNSATKTIILRLGVVLAREGGALATMARPFRLGMGGIVGSGNQFMSWITLTDLVRVIDHLVHTNNAEGIYNATSPEPVTNRALTRALGNVLHRPTLVPLPAFAARLVLGEMADGLLLASAKALPARLLAEGFPFEDPALEPALKKLLA